MLARGLSILRCFRPHERELPLSELARRADMPKATAHRIVAELLKERMLERGENGLRLGVSLFVLGARVPRQMELRGVTRPFVERLHRLTRGGAYVFMSDALDGSAGLVDSVYFSHDSEREFGEQVCISTNAAGEILRFHGAPSNRTEVNDTVFGSLGGEEPARVRRKDLVVLRMAETVALAAPLLLSPDTVIGALAVSAPTGRLRETQAASHLQAAAAAASRALQRTPELARWP
ncbi:helix-turn-helix domain-containing protein [Streptomyces ossamyceticus]|jgi:DNA-binding IclR family transcriptional regulator|uniref:helix-turn-helix domain-containing protein n=1 Tax=Streptomyces ossamyceticus TaxID=249581 RepID=UPI0006E4018D|nr:helix-turn-helix domain-containing protein [Streptomyces ossamyceticus]